LIDFIHVGDYKTGTTYLQKEIFPNHPEIQYLGDTFTNSIHEEIFRKIVDMRDLDFNSDILKSKYERSYTKERKYTGVSREALSQSNFITGEHAKRNAERIKSIFGNVKIIYVIRDQISMLESIYSQYIKMGGTRSFNNWFLDPIECRGIIERLKYDKNIQMYYDIFGKDNVLVLLYDELKEDKQKFINKIFTFIGVKTNIKLLKQKQKKVNSSLTTVGGLFLRIMNKCLRNQHHRHESTILHIDKIIYLLLSKRNKEKLGEKSKHYILPNYHMLDEKQRILYTINMILTNKARLLAEKISIGQKIKITDNVKKKIIPYFISSNNLLKEIYELSIDKYNWYIK
jgi:hypothetical protein